MNGTAPLVAVAVAALMLLAGCTDGEVPAETAAPPAAPTPSTAAAAAPPPFMPAATVLELMNGPIVHAAEVFWGSVAVVVDAEGVHEMYPETDEQWEQVWAAALTIAESGNLLLIGPRAVDSGPWQRYSLRLVEAGMRAAAAAQARDTEQIFATGEEVYNVCAGCHDVYSPDASETRAESEASTP